MDVSVLIPAINEQDSIAAAIESVLRAGATQVIVIDGGSTDQTRSVAMQAGGQLVESGAGRGRQLRSGLVHAHGDYVVILHADCRFGREALRPLLDGHQRSPVWGGFLQQIDHPGWAFRFLAYRNATRVRRRGLVFGDQALFVRRSTLLQIGGIPDVPLLEDVMLSDALKKICPPVLLPGPVIVSARRWQRHGVVRQTLRNAWIMTQYRSGVPPERLAKQYRRHDG